MIVRDTSKTAFDKLKERKQLEPDQQAIFNILLEIGPAHDRRILEALNQKEQSTLLAKPKSQRRKWEINSVTGRRNALVNPPYGPVEDLGKYTGIWNAEKKTYHFWRCRGDARQPAGWVKVEEKPTTIPQPPQKEYVKVKGQNRTEPTEQLMLGL